jgi:hypothetical protein
MTHPGMESRLDAALDALPREVEPGRDLWVGIESHLEPRQRRWPSRWIVQAAAAVVLVAVSSVLTATLMRREVPMARAPAPNSILPVQMTEAAFGPSYALDPEYAAARRQLAAQLEQRVARLPPSAQAKLKANLAEMRRAAEEINAALARQPGDPLLEELLLNTYQDELGVLASVNQLTSTSAAAAVARKEKLQL